MMRFRGLLTLLVAMSACACGPEFVGIDPEPDAGGGGGDAAADAMSSAIDGGQATDAPDARVACTCANDLTDVGTDDFAIAFTVVTSMHPSTPGYGAILNQRSECDSQKAGWDVWLNGSTADGTVQLQVYGGGNVFDNVGTAQAVNDGHPHRVVISRHDSGTRFTLSVDGQGVTYTNPSLSLTGTMPPVQVGSDPVCAQNMAAPPQPLAGQIRDVCVAIRCVPSDRLP